MQAQFFNTGRNVINAFDFLYDGLHGYAGLKPNGLAIPSANIQFTPGFYPNPIPEPTVLGLLLGVVAWGCGRWLTRRISSGGKISFCLR